MIVRHHLHRGLRAFAGPLLLLTVSPVVHAGDDAAEAPFYSRWWHSAVSTTTELATNGDWNAYFPTKIYHLPIAYTAEQRNRYNESPMPAFGFGRSHYLADGDWEGLYAMGFKDSNEKPSWMLGYARSWLWDMPRLNGAYYGLGFTAFLMAREDYASYLPFPAALPTFTLGFKNVALETAFVPGGKGNGNVFFIWFKLNEKERPWQP